MNGPKTNMLQGKIRLKSFFFKFFLFSTSCINSRGLFFHSEMPLYNKHVQTRLENCFSQHYLALVELLWLPTLPMNQHSFSIIHHFPHSLHCSFYPGPKRNNALAIHLPSLRFFSPTKECTPKKATRCTFLTLEKLGHVEY